MSEQIVEALLAEGVWDKETTVLSRYIVKEVKKIFSRGLPQTLRPEEEKGPAVMFTVPRRVMEPYLARDYLPQGIKVFVRYIRRNRAVGSWGFMHWEGTRVTKTRGVELGINLSPFFDHRRDFEEMVATLKRSIRHELEHTGQKSKDLYATGKLFRRGITDLQTHEAYLKDPTEVPAFASGAYKYAKSQKIPYNEAIDEYLEAQFSEVIGIHKPQVQAMIKPVKERVKAVWLAYAEKRFPQAWIEESLTEETHSRGCLMLDFDLPNWDRIQNQVVDEDVHEEAGGREENPHITILYGYHQDVDPSMLKTVMSKPDKIKITGISIFAKPETDYDVVKFDSDSSELHKLHQDAKGFPHDLTHPEYHPHMTIAYVKRGAGQKYVRKFKRPVELAPHSFRYSAAGDDSEFTRF